MKITSRLSNYGTKSVATYGKKEGDSMKTIRMTKEQWLNRMSIGCSKSLIKAIWGDNLDEIDKYLINAESREYYEHDIYCFKTDIDLVIGQLEWLKERIAIPYNEIVRNVLTKDEILDWISEHETLTEDFEYHFGGSIEDYYGG